MHYRISRNFSLAIWLLCCLTLFPMCVQGRVITVTREDSGKTIDLRVDDVLQIQLGGTPTTRAWWFFQDLDEQYLKIVKEYTRPIPGVPEKIDGGPIMGVWELLATNPGTTTVRMAYSRDEQNLKTAVRWFTVELRINTKGF
jgi:predicted secreted protein